MNNYQRASKRGFKVFLCVLLVCIFSFFSLSKTSIAASQSVNKLIEGAKKEGQINYYASMSVEESRIIITEFEKKYPFLKVKMLRLNSGQLLTKTLTEYRMNKNSADVLQTVEFSMQILMQKGILGQYVSKENGFYPKESKEEGYWICAYCNPYVVAYSSKLVKPQDIPKAYDDLLNPRWKGKMIMESEKVDWFAGMLEIMGREKGLKFMRELSKQDIIKRTGHTLIGTLVVAGEAELQINTPNTVTDRIKKKGAPLDWVALGPVPGIMIGIGIASKPPHPNAAKLYVDFMLSKKSQTFLRDLGRTSLRSDVVRPPSTKDLNIVVVNPALANNMNEYMTLFREIFLK
ncbi:ABC transporter substrate-binding protein [Thermodesulfobacteriota bacterium]